MDYNGDGNKKGVRRMAKTAAKTVGKVTHYYDKLGVGIVKLSQGLKVGDKVRFVGHTTDFDQVVGEIQYNHQNVTSGKKGQEVGIKVETKVRDGDKVELVS